MKKPDEIKKGLGCLTKDNAPDAECEGCPYFEELGYLHWSCHRGKIWADTFILIQQLEAQNAQQARCIENMTDKLSAMNDEVAKLQAEIEKYEEAANKCCYESQCNAELNHLEALCKRLKDENEQLQAERDAAVSELVGICQVCRWEETAKCASCHFCEDAWNTHESNWEWRGVQKEEVDNGKTEH